MADPQIHFNSQLLVSEMKRRGIRVTQVPETKTLMAKYRKHKEIIDDTDLSVMPATLRYLLDDKWKTKKLLKKLKFPTADGKVFLWKDIEKAKKYAKKLLPAVIKPVYGAQGKGVRVHLDTVEEFEREFYKLTKAFGEDVPFLVEKHVDGAEFRLTVTKNGFFAAVFRACPKIIGDGKKSIKKLIEGENKIRTHPRKNCLCPIWLEDGEVERYLMKKGLTLDFIPKKGETVYVRGNSNVSTGAQCIDVTDLVHPFYKKTAFEIFKKIPGLPYCGIDIITEDISAHHKDTPYIVCEINPAPGISLHTHPSIGKSRNLTEALVDLIFPETTRSPYSDKPRSIVIHKKLNTLEKLRHHFQRKMPKNWFFKPISLEVEMTHVCNLRCTGCTVIEEVEKGFPGFSAKEAVDILHQCAKASIYCYSLTGGEPFIFLDRMCEIIKQSPIDLFKIQTNGSVFASRERAEKIFKQLINAGFLKNQYLKPSINCSIGMQTKAGAPLKHIAILTAVFLETFHEEVSLAFNVLPYGGDKEADEILSMLEGEYKKLTGDQLPYEKVRLNQFGMEYTKRLAEKNLITLETISLRERVEELGKGYICFNFDADSPVPRILIRADGTLYPCSCFGHVASPGNIHQTSLHTLLSKINKNKLFQVVAEKGLYGLMKEVEKRDPDLLDIKIPKTFSVCKVCKAFREPEWIRSFKTPHGNL